MIERKLKHRRIESFDTAHQWAIGVFADTEHHIGEYRNEQQRHSQ